MAYHDIRTIDGSGNNSDLGKANVPLIRLLEPVFEDGISIPRGGQISEFDHMAGKFVYTSTLPNPRTISNIVIEQTQPVTNFLNASDWLWQWGQLLDHDLVLNEANEEKTPAPEDFTPIPVPYGDPTFPDGAILPFIRVPAAEGTGKTTPRQVNNQITAFIDASSVYGSDEKRAKFLRDTESSKGLLKTTIGDNGEILLPLNDPDNPQPNATGGTGLPVEKQFVAGDVRANEQIGLTAVHILLVREHNLVALELHERLEAGDRKLRRKFRDFRDQVWAKIRTENPGVSREEIQEIIKDEFLYQSARKVIGAKVQVITYNEFLPLLIGKSTLEAYKGFNPDINPQISVEFANAAYRLGHTLISNKIRRVDHNGITETNLADAFFNPADVQEKGIDTVLTGLIFQKAQELDNIIVDELRNFLFPAGTGGLDLGAVNIARGREIGLPSYTKVYEEIFGTKIKDFDHLRELGLFSNSVVNLFETTYEPVNQIDLWLAGISELPADHGGLLGPTFSFFIAEQFTRSRDGDKFFYLNDLEHLRILAPDIEDTTLATLIRNNVADSYLVPDNAFKVSFENSLFGDDSNNILNGTAFKDLIDGQGGNDKIRGRRGDDTLFGGLGDDYILGKGGADKLVGGDGNDTLQGNSGSDYINGSAGNDLIRGGGGADAIRGGTGNDLIYGRGGGDTYIFDSNLLDDVADMDTIKGFQAIDDFDFKDYLGAGGTVEFELIGRRALQIDLSGEDSVYVFGSRHAINAAVDQLNNLDSTQKERMFMNPCQT